MWRVVKNNQYLDIYTGEWKEGLLSGTIFRSYIGALVWASSEEGQVEKLKQ